MHTDMKRVLSPYEKTHLARYSSSPVRIEMYGETPVEYITGKVEFAGHVFDVSPEVLIPRLETEELVKLAVTEISHLENAEIAIADVGTGSGAIGISLFLAVPSSQQSIKVFLSDISASALTVAQQNVTKLIPSDLQSHFTLLESDLMHEYDANQQFDLIVANLPYIPSDRIPYLDSSVKDYEPYIALNGGSDGLQLIKAFLNEAPKYLKAAGIILLEVDYTHTIAEVIHDTSAFVAKPILDQFHRQRFIKITKR